MWYLFGKVQFTFLLFKQQPKTVPEIFAMYSKFFMGGVVRILMVCLALNGHLTLSVFNLNDNRLGSVSLMCIY